VEIPQARGGFVVRILVAEDNPLNQKVLVRLLSGLNCTVDAVENGQQVLDAVQRTRYDLVLMDVRMPELDGIQATKQLRQLLPAAECPVVYAVTAGVSAEERRECLAAGMCGFLAKPVQLEDLRTMLANLPAQ
jgi:CheY-like chemotaxis protein